MIFFRHNQKFYQNSSSPSSHALGLIVAGLLLLIIPKILDFQTLLSIAGFYLIYKGLRALHRDYYF